jgi:hypothetical protein
LVAGLLFIVAFPACRNNRKETAEPPQNTGTDQIVSTEKKEMQAKVNESVEEIMITTTPAEGQYLLDLEKSLYVSFSEPVDPKDFSFEVTPDLGEWEITWRQKNRLAVLKHGMPFVKDASYEWAVRLKDIQIAVQFIASGPSSLQLIEEAEKLEILDMDMAWIYRLQRLHEPVKLPEEYRSLAPVRCGTLVWKEFKHIEAELKPETVLQLQPYLVRPTHPDSIYNRPSAVDEADTALTSWSGSGLLYAQENQEAETDEEELERPENMFSYVDWQDKIRVWYRKGGEAKAKRAVYWLEQKRMWARFEELMGIEPLSDEYVALHCDDIMSRKGRELCRQDSCGGDGKLDIYLVPPTEPGMYDPEDKESDYGWCRAVSSGETAAAFLVINRDLSESPKNYFAATIAHELFHAFQDAWAAKEEEWWVEGSAVWSEDFIGPEWNTEQEDLDHAFDDGDHTLITLTSDEGMHPYGIYLFPFHLSHKFGEQEIGYIWQYCGLEDTDTLEAVKREVGNFKECFKEFALHTTDRGKHEGFYTDFTGPIFLWDRHFEENHDITPEVKPILPFEVKIPPLAAKYYCFYNECEPGSMPHIRFDLEDFIKDEKVTVQAIIDPHGRAEDQDWSELEEKDFCINREEEHFEEIYIVIASEHEYQDFEGELRIEMSATECDDCYAYVTRTYDYEHQSGESRTEREKTATIYLGFGPAAISGIASMSMDKQMVMYPFKTLQIAGGSAHYMHRTPRKVEERSGKVVEAPMPKLPAVPVGDQMMAPIFLILYTDVKTGKVIYAMIPDPDVKIVWDNGTEEFFDIGKVSQEEVPVEGMFGPMPPDGVVSSGDGEKQFAGGGEHEYTNRGRSSYEHCKETYTWKIFRRKSPRKDK